MSVLFTPINIGAMQIENRFVHSATYQCMASPQGEVTDDLLKRYENLSRAGIGLIISGFMYVHPLGQGGGLQIGIHNDDMIPGLTTLAETVHRNGGKIAFQLHHAGRLTSKALIGRTPMGPSSVRRDPVSFVKPRQMTELDIEDTIEAFGNAAYRAAQAGADAIQFHAAHGHLISQFLSPFFNHREDDWGGSDINRFRFLREVILNARKKVPPRMPLLVKLNGRDYTSVEGVTPPLSATYAKWLVELGIDAIEVSCGTGTHSPMNLLRGDVPVKEITSAVPMPRAELWWGRMAGKYGIMEGYNLEAAQVIKAAIGGIPLMVVGGFRNLVHMEEAVAKGRADCISMARPFIREPFLVQTFKQGKSDTASCISCNKCFAALLHNLPVRCYVKGLPIV